MSRLRRMWRQRGPERESERAGDAIVQSIRPYQKVLVDCDGTTVRVSRAFAEEHGLSLAGSPPVTPEELRRQLAEWRALAPDHASAPERADAWFLARDPLDVFAPRLP